MCPHFDEVPGKGTADDVRGKVGGKGAKGVNNFSVFGGKVEKCKKRDPLYYGFEA